MNTDRNSLTIVWTANVLTLAGLALALYFGGLR